MYVTDHSISSILGLDPDRPRRRQRRSRTIFPDSTIETLEAAFSKNRYPDIKDRLILAQQVEEEEARVQVWFQNRRARFRRSKRARSRQLSQVTMGTSSSSSPKTSPSLPPVNSSWLQFLVTQKECQLSPTPLVQEVDIQIEENHFLEHNSWTTLPSLSPTPPPVSPLSPTHQRSVLRLPLKKPCSSFSIEELLV